MVFTSSMLAACSFAMFSSFFITSLSVGEAVSKRYEALLWLFLLDCTEDGRVINVLLASDASTDPSGWFASSDDFLSA